MLDYIHSAETEQFSFLRVPKILLQNDTFKGISAEAKLLYSILFDRTELSNRNGWRDDQDRVYIIFTIAEITESMNCGNKKAIQLLDELEHKAGLIERKRQGLGKPNLIYDELELDTIGDRKTALFLIMSDTDATFNFLISMIYTQLFNLLCEKADDVYGGRLPVHVRCLIDEAANIGQIPNLENWKSWWLRSEAVRSPPAWCCRQGPS